MEKNKQDLQQDTFLKKYLQEIELDKVKDNFAASIMNTILVEEKKAVLTQNPLISRKMWALSVGFILTCLFVLFNGKSKSAFEFPTLNLSFLSEIKMPNLFADLTISTTVLYAVVVFSLMIFVQIFYLKNHFNKQFD